MEARANQNTALTISSDKHVKYYIKRSNSRSEDSGKRSLLSMPSSPCTVEIGSFYEIDHEKLDPKSPIHLRSIRIVKVCEKTNSSVTVSFPSSPSLRNFLSRSSNRNEEEVENGPEMDQRFAMSSTEASKTLYKPVPSSLFCQERTKETFWLLNPTGVRYYYTKRNKLGASEGMQKTSHSSRQSLPSFSYTAQFEVGDFYEIDHEQLHEASPIQLKSIRVVKVCEKTSFGVTVSFPSALSLRNFFSGSGMRSVEAEEEPEMDERYFMSSSDASKILRKQVPSSVFYQERSMDNFWLLNPVTPPSTRTRLTEEPERRIKKPVGLCLVALRSSVDLKWGIRRRVKYVGKHRDLLSFPKKVNKNHSIPEKNVPRKEAEVNAREEMEETGEEEEESSSSEEEESEESEEVKKAMVRVKTEMPLGGKKKRKREIPPALDKRRNTWEKEKKRKHNVREPKEYRWSAGRYKSAEQSLLEVMKDIGANPDRPVVRHALREEARKFIGDTGLLDHLLKHMSGKVLSEGTERFVRRHNSEGAIEYWLEPAELADIRQQAGVTDPFWFPPPGWKPGEAVSVCRCGEAHCNAGSTQVNDEILLLKREVEELKTLMQSDEKEKTEAQMQLQTVNNSWKEKYENLLIQQTKLQEQITSLSVSLLSMKEDMCNLKEDKDKKRDEERNATVPRENSNGKSVANANNIEDGKLEERPRKSGFRICKPEGTFLWPNMGSTSSLSLSNNYFNAGTGCPTPPSTSSATSAPPKPFMLPSPTSLPSPAAYSGPSASRYPSNVMMNMGSRERREIMAERKSDELDRLVFGAAPTVETETDSDEVLTDLALATLSY